jgi:hypothetical protein
VVAPGGTRTTNCELVADSTIATESLNFTVSSVLSGLKLAPERVTTESIGADTGLKADIERICGLGLLFEGGGESCLLQEKRNKAIIMVVRILGIMVIKNYPNVSFSIDSSQRYFPPSQPKKINLF